MAWRLLVRALDRPHDPAAIRPRRQNPLLADWTGPFGLPPLPAIKPEHFRPAFDRRLAAHRAEIDAIAADPAAAELRQHHRGAGEERARPRPRLQRLLRAGRRRHRRRPSRRSSARSRRCSPATATRCTSTARSMPASPSSIAGATRSASTPSRPACSTATTPASCGPAARSTSRRRIASPPSTSGWRASAPSSGRTCWRTRRPMRLMLEEGDLAGLPDFARAAARAAAEERGHPGKYAITLARSSCESFLQFSSRRDLREKIFQAWIKRGENGGATDNRALIAEMVGLRAERAKLLGLCDLRRLPARRSDGQDAAGGAQAARRGLGPRARQGRGRARRAAEDDRGRGRQFRARAVGLALLRREAAQGEIRLGRSRDQAVFPARQDGRGRLRDRAPAVRPQLHARQRAALSPGRPRLRGEGRQAAAMSACSSATISRAAPSTAAPG